MCVCACVCVCVFGYPVICDVIGTDNWTVEMWRSPLVTCAWQNWLQDRRPLLQSHQTTTAFVSYWSTLACPQVIYVRNTVNTVLINKHCLSSVLMLRPHRLDHSSLICTHCWQFHYSFSSQPVRRPRLVWYIPLPGLSRVINSLLTYLLPCRPRLEAQCC